MWLMTTMLGRTAMDHKNRILTPSFFFCSYPSPTLFSWSFLFYFMDLSPFEKLIGKVGLGLLHHHLLKGQPCEGWHPLHSQGQATAVREPLSCPGTQGLLSNRDGRNAGMHLPVSRITWGTKVPGIWSLEDKVVAQWGLRMGGEIIGEMKTEFKGPREQGRKRTTPPGAEWGSL